MDASTIQPAAAGVATAQPQRTGMDSLQSEDFFKILVTELQSQDPLAPSSTSDMIQQVSQIRSIEQANTLNSTLQRLADQKPIGDASALIGKYITAKTIDASGTESQFVGLVSGVRFEKDGTVMLELDNGQVIRLADVVAVSSVDPSETATGAAAAAPTSAPAADAGAADAAKDGTQRPIRRWPSLRELLGV